CKRADSFAGNGDCARRFTDSALGESSLSAGSGDSRLPGRVLRLESSLDDRVQMGSASQNSRIKPRALRPGDKVGIVAPASNVKREMLEAGCDGLRRAGYEPFYFESILERDLYFAGSPERRARELEDMFVRDDIRAIVCARGGYGSNYLPLTLDPTKIVPNPKILVGYSDITTLVCCIADSANLVTFHGPMVAKDFAVADGVDLDSWQNAMGGAAEWRIAEGSGARPLLAGQGEGILYGRCLSMLVASLGTPPEIR